MSKREEQAPTSKPSPRQAAVAVAILVFLSLSLFLWSECKLKQVLETFNQSAAPQSPSTAREDPSPETVFSRLVPRMEKQKEQYSSWAYTALAAIVAICVVKRVLPSPWIRWIYILLGAAAVLLLQTLRAGVYFDQRLTYLSVRASLPPGQFVGIQSLLGLQVNYLTYGLILLLLFVGSFVVAIVAGKLDLVLAKETEDA